MEKPLIPKRFATRIRMAQEKVTDACKNIVNDDIANAQDLDRIAEFEADSKAFARKYYGNKTADSYPVQTNISRCRENIIRRRNRRYERVKALEKAKQDLAATEEEILYEVNRMRPNTPGRVSWPTPPLALEQIRRIEQEAVRQAEIEDNIKEEQKQLEIQRELEAETTEAQRIYEEEQAEHDKEWKATLENMSPKERRRAKKFFKTILDGLRSGKITPAQIIEHLKSLTKEFKSKRT